ncbi:hypothetical protein SeMB42_g04430 [Synchytrium endobioticum]|uniref:CobW/HypB/UreG nucleotide-binding domain-containing protein n=1 Tax=Synchytrium endobioticum TaxID=286115 RepID=A0A507C762_9FUNG|nr:hypothetical protein SeLEV6574_g08230 [Synchytrium endobioticum]TPX44133.1 hypothetical protein SeMB42_g04416 [Synchytrium endobioticum]TPX44136.1 hypothetical protein SeMB42_g04430 [Synchytrium endobioticum]
MVPVTVFTGFLGAGKTTIIINLIKSLPSTYNIVILKNEFGDLAVDSQIAQASSNNVKVTEMLNGCFCCVLVGKMKNGLIDIRDQFKPDRIIVETSGSAFPAPIAWQIREMEPEGFKLDAIITVVDSINFRGYEDTSYTAKMQAKYTDLIIMNKSELVSERDYDLVMDKVYELNEDTPKIKAGPKGVVNPNLLLGFDTKLFQLKDRETDMKTLAGADEKHHLKEVDLIQVLVNEHVSSFKNHHHDHAGQYRLDERRHGPTIATSAQPVILHTSESLASALASLPSDSVYRIKGLIRLSSENVGTASFYILNYAFGRHEIIPLSITTGEEGVIVKLTIMGVGLRLVMGRLKQLFGARDGYDLFELIESVS